MRVFEVDSVVRQRRRAPRSQRRPHDAHPSARVRYELWLQAWPVVNHLGSWMSHANSASADVATASRPKRRATTAMRGAAGRVSGPPSRRPVGLGATGSGRWRSLELRDHGVAVVQEREAPLEKRVGLCGRLVSHTAPLQCPLCHARVMPRPRHEPSPDERQAALPLAKAPARRAPRTPKEIAKTVTDRDPSPSVCRGRPRSPAPLPAAGRARRRRHPDRRQPEDQSRAPRPRLVPNLGILAPVLSLSVGREWRTILRITPRSGNGFSEVDEGSRGLVAVPLSGGRYCIQAPEPAASRANPRRN